MSFGLCSAPSTFRALIGAILRGLLDEGIITYIDYIMISSVLD